MIPSIESKYVEVYAHFQKHPPNHIWKWMSEDTKPGPPPDSECEHCGMTYAEFEKGYALPEFAYQIMERMK